MGIFSRIKSMFRGRVTDEKMWNPGLWNLLRSQTTSGEQVDEHSALTYSAVFNAITLISGSIASLPLHLMQRRNQTTTPATSHALYRVMHSRANPYMTSMAMRECLIAHILAWGNGYAEIVRDSFGRVVELWPIPPNRIRPEMDEGVLYYVVRVDSEDKKLPRERVLHVPGLGFDGFLGYSVVNMAAQSIGLGKAMETFGANYFGQGTHPGVVVSHPGKLSETAAKNLENSLTKEYSGLGKTHRLMLLEDGLKLEKIGIPPNDSQFIESRTFQIPEIARWFNLPPHKLKDLTRSSFSNIESEQISFVTDSLLPWGVRLEQNYNMQLLTDQEVQAGLYFKHVFEGLLRGNSVDRSEYYRKMWSIGALTQNEIRGLEDKNPSPDPFADELFVPMNMIPISKIEDHLAKKKEGKPALPEADKGNDGQDITETDNQRDDMAAKRVVLLRTAEK